MWAALFGWVSKNKHQKLFVPLVIVGITLVFVVPCAVYGYAHWHQYHIWNFETLEASKPEPNSSQAEWSNWYNLKAQQEMAEWAYSLLWVGVIGLVTSIAGIGFIFLNLRSLNEQNRIAQQTGEAQTRPYLSILPEVTMRETSPTYLGRTFNLSFSVQNAGTTPVVDPKITAVLYLDSEFTNPPDRENPIFVSALEGQPSISSGHSKLVELHVRNRGIPEVANRLPIALFDPKDPLSEGIDPSSMGHVVDDGIVGLCLQVFVEFSDFAGSKQEPIGVEFYSVGALEFRKRLHEVTFKSTRTLKRLDISNESLIKFRYDCPATSIFGVK